MIGRPAPNNRPQPPTQFWHLALKVLYIPEQREHDLRRDVLGRMRITQKRVRLTPDERQIAGIERPPSFGVASSSTVQEFDIRQTTPRPHPTFRSRPGVPNPANNLDGLETCRFRKAKTYCTASFWGRKLAASIVGTERNSWYIRSIQLSVPRLRGFANNESRCL